MCLAVAECSPVTPPDAREPAPAAVVADDGKQALPAANEMERLARDNPIGFLEDCIRRYQREVKGYRCTFQKQERLEGKLQDKEVIEAWYREKPHSALFHWLSGARRADAALYVEGENNDKMLARPRGELQRAVAGEVVERDLDSADARQSGRYTLKEFGIKESSLRTLATWQEAKKNGSLHVEYLGLIKVKEAGDRECYGFHRTGYDKPDADGVSDLKVYFDKETWLQVGSVLKGDGNKLLGEYYFRDIQLNPDFKPDQFTRAGLKP